LRELGGIGNQGLGINGSQQPLRCLRSKPLYQTRVQLFASLLTSLISL
jgi:hypothetical protein